MNKTSQGQDFLGKTIQIKFDRPIGTKHPKYDHMIYPVNYGFVPGTKAGDGMEIDVYYLSSDKPLKNIEGKCIAYVHRFDDNEDKLVATEGSQLTKEEIENNGMSDEEASESSEEDSEQGEDEEISDLEEQLSEEEDNKKKVVH